MVQTSPHRLALSVFWYIIDVTCLHSFHFRVELSNFEGEGLQSATTRVDESRSLRNCSADDMRTVFDIFKRDRAGLVVVVGGEVTWFTQKLPKCDMQLVPELPHPHFAGDVTGPMTSGPTDVEYNNSRFYAAILVSIMILPGKKIRRYLHSGAYSNICQLRVKRQYK